MISNEKTYLFLLAFMIFSSASLCKYSANIFVQFFYSFFLSSFVVFSVPSSIRFVPSSDSFRSFFFLIRSCIQPLQMLILLLHFCICISCMCSHKYEHSCTLYYMCGTLTVDMDMDLFFGLSLFCTVNERCVCNVHVHTYIYIYFLFIFFYPSAYCPRSHFSEHRKESWYAGRIEREERERVCFSVVVLQFPCHLGKHI